MNHDLQKSSQLHMAWPHNTAYVLSLFVKIASTIFFFCGRYLHRNREQSCVYIIELVMKLAGAQKMIQKTLPRLGTLLHLGV